MILKGILDIIFGLLKTLFGWIDLPDMPETITNVIDQVIGYIVDGLPVIWVFFDKQVVTVVLVLVLAIVNFDKIYYFIMWLLKKLPIGVK